jgi:shikimate kinase
MIKKKTDPHPNHHNLSKPIVLVGLMGAGKTTVGVRLAKTLGLPFIDSDQEIEKSTSCSISDLFFYAGEEYFRQAEKKVVLQLLALGPSVIATGGGAFLNPGIREAIQESAVSVWINATLSVLVDRVSRRNVRPLLEQGNKAEILQNLIETRYPVYQLADITVNSDKGPHNIIIRDIIAQIEKYHG